MKSDEDAAFAICLSVTAIAATLRMIYAATLPVSFESHAVAGDVLTGTAFVMLSFFPRLKDMYKFAALARSFAIMAFMHIGLLPTVIQIYWSGRRWPLADDALARADRVLGFDWLAYVHWIDVHPRLIPWLHFAYESIWWQAIVVGLVTVCSGQSRRTYVLAAAEGLSLSFISAITVFAPAYGAYTHFGQSLATLPNLTMGDLGSMKIPLDHLRAGIFDAADARVALVQFPSFHATEVILMIWAAWRTVLRWPAIVLNAGMLAATPVFGSHYLSDMLAGAAVGALTIYVINAVIDSFLTARPTYALSFLKNGNGRRSRHRSVAQIASGAL